MAEGGGFEQPVAAVATAEEVASGSGDPLATATRKWSPREGGGGGCQKCDSVRHRHPLHRN